MSKCHNVHDFPRKYTFKQRRLKEDKIGHSPPVFLKTKQETLELDNGFNWSSLHEVFKKILIVLIAFSSVYFYNIIKLFVYAFICKQVDE